MRRGARVAVLKSRRARRPSLLPQPPRSRRPVSLPVYGANGLRRKPSRSRFRQRRCPNVMSPPISGVGPHKNTRRAPRLNPAHRRRLHRSAVNPSERAPAAPDWRSREHDNRLLSRRAANPPLTTDLAEPATRGACPVDAAPRYRAGTRRRDALRTDAAFERLDRTNPVARDAPTDADAPVAEMRSTEAEAPVIKTRTTETETDVPFPRSFSNEGSKDTFSTPT